MSTVQNLLFKQRYNLAFVIACLTAAIPFMIGVETGHTAIGFIAAVLIYVPSGLYIEQLKNRRHKREKDIIVRTLR